MQGGHVRFAKTAVVSVLPWKRIFEHGNNKKNWNKSSQKTLNQKY